MADVIRLPIHCEFNKLNPCVDVCEYVVGNETTLPDATTGGV